ncbi:hypothetical protein LEP1GSC058_1292 [Leptospira fainei serovar Hurstbridge str. BUT 6]|uniref:PF07611 family protein n=1 Tax=Leptospira fainei serovar Hurstbridge str. BUT 6 TaxID=1193011 RepID=S3VIV0_9LEPT|nr:hypothetical protein [Leptospira fainei]EPG76395.1 hypothetical protein LEP1GSC058_1292 [Leptospira fainei serovar Hurstbridge str. BUT 6]
MRKLEKNKIIIWMGAFLLSLILASNFLFELLLPFQEKNAFLYELLRKQFEKQLSYDNAKSREPSWLFLGDSQLMSGMDPQVLQRSTGKRIVFLPRPSEQPEGILIRIKELLSAGLKPEKIFLNANYFNTADVDIVPAHRSLVLNYDSFRWSIYWNSQERNFYFRNVGDALFFALARIFPLMKLNSAISSEIRTIPKTEQFLETDPRLAEILSINPVERWKSNRKKNEQLRAELERSGGFLEWNNSKTYTGNCVPNTSPQALPGSGWESNYKRMRSSSLVAWKLIFKILQKENISFEVLLIPSRPDFVAAVGGDNALSEFEGILKAGGIPVIKPDEPFEISVFGDYTHLNACGVQKLTRWFLKRENGSVL